MSTYKNIGFGTLRSGFWEAFGAAASVVSVEELRN